MSQPFDRQQETEKLNSFLSGFPDLHDDFLDQAEAQGFALSLGLESLEELERYLLQAQASADPQAPDNVFNPYVHGWYQLGEIVRTAFGGYWSVSGEDPEPGKWVIKNFRTGTGRTNAEFDPKRLVRSFIRRPSAGVFKRAITAETDASAFLELKARLDALPDEE